MNNKVVAALLYFYAIIFSILKAIRLPNQWAEAHWLLDYRFGFIKRGLGGEIFGWFFEKTPNNIFIISVVMLILLYASVLAIAIKQVAKNPQSIYRIFFFLIFFLSQYLVYSAHLIGYMDHLVFLVAILAVQLIKNNKILPASILATFCMLVHELSFLLMVPICFFALIVNNIPEKFSVKAIFDLSLLKKISLFLILPLAAMIAISANQELHGIENRTAILNYLTDSGFIDKGVAISVSAAYTESFKDYLASESPHFIQRIFISKASIKFGIPILFSMFLIYKEFIKVNVKILLLLAVVSLLPLLLHAIAWDTYRIWSFPFMILFLGFWILSCKFQPAAVPVGKLTIFEIIVLILSVTLVALATSPLLDGYEERFSLPERIMISFPVFLGIFIILRKKPQFNTEA